MRLSAIIILCVLLFSCKEKKSNNDLVRMNLNGKVKMITEKDYFIDTTGNNKGKHLRWTITYTFNTNGFITEKVQTDDKGDLNVKYTYRYDTADHLLEEQITGDEPIATTTYKYSENFHTAEAVMIPADAGGISYRFSYVYTDDKLPIGKTMETDDSNAPHQGKSVYTWVYKENYWYDKEKRKVKCRRADSDSLIQTTLYKYDENGNCIEEKTDTARPHSVLMTRRKFDDKGNEIEITSYENDGSIHAHTTRVYKSFDEAGNWLQQYIHWKDLGTTVTERTIQYYSQK